MSSSTTPRASEGGHFYSQDGRPVYEVPTVDGKKMKAVTIREARLMNLGPGVTSIIKCADAPMLTVWKQEQTALAAERLPRLEGEDDKTWQRRVIEAAGEIAANAATRGTEIHAALERHFSGEPVDAAWQPWIDAVEIVLPKPERSPWIAELAVSHYLGYGTKSDLFSRELNVVLDFKGTDKDLTRLEVYDTHDMQLAATREALGMETARCGIVYVHREKPEATLIWCEEKKLERGWAMFRALLAYWQHKNRHIPNWERDEVKL